jgi:hypothetical protein
MPGERALKGSFRTSDLQCVRQVAFKYILAIIVAAAQYADYCLNHEEN